MFHTDGMLFKNAFGTEELRAVFTEERYVERFLEVEAALARAEAEAGLIPESAADEITRTATLEHLDFDAVEETIAEIDLFTVAIIQNWKDAIGESGEYIHWGATSQDIADTAIVLLIRDALEKLRTDLAAIGNALEELATEYAETPMIGRTHHVHALPITFGLKAANWLDELSRDLDRFETAAERAMALQFFGAVGTLASLGTDGLEVQRRLADELDLSAPNTAWHASRDRFAELLDAFAALAGTMSRIARQVLVLGREEIGEINEHIPEGMIGSSTMPHKRNPVKAERIVGLAALVRGQASIMHDLLEGYDERDAGLWYAEYAVIPESCLYLGRILRYGHELLEDLHVDEERMRENLEYHDGLVTSEAVMMALANEVGRQTAHEIVHEAAMEAMDGSESFHERLLTDDRIADVFSEEELREMTDPQEYTGLSGDLARETVDEI